MTAITIPTGFRYLPLPLAQLSLATVLKCGQSFRWSSHLISTGASPEYEYRFCLQDRVVCLRQSSDTLFYRSVIPDGPLDQAKEDAREEETLNWLKDYFQLDVDLVKLYDEWSERDPVFRNISSRFPGVRVLRQDPWENLVSFICSSNNNIARITRMVTTLCTHYSPPLLSSLGPDSDVSYHPFPPPSSLASPEVAMKLRSLGFGYRADFIQRTAQILVNKHDTAAADSSTTEAAEIWLLTLRDLDTAKAREELLKFVGVGRKVADCVLLMSLDKKDVIPVDTHVHQIATKYYGFRSHGGSKKVSMTPKLYDEIVVRLVATWGEYAGWAHTVLFTSDLKIFSSNETLVSSPSTSTPTPTNEHSTNKRTRKFIPPDDELPILTYPTQDDPTEDVSLADRVKKRRRACRIDVP